MRFKANALNLKLAAKINFRNPRQLSLHNRHEIRSMNIFNTFLPLQLIFAFNFEPQDDLVFACHIKYYLTMP